VRFAFASASKPDSRQPSLLRDVLDSVLAVAFPTNCSLCGNELGGGRLRICGACWAELQPWQGPICERCGLPFASARALDSSVGECGDCRADVSGFDAARNFGLYTGKLRKAVLRLKFGGDERLGAHLGELLAAPWDSLAGREGSNQPLIIPVPLHPSRQRERGFNQSELLAMGLAQRLGKHGRNTAPQVAKSVLLRRRATPPQTGLSVSARRENLRGAFEVSKLEAVRGKTIVLIDDVMTTGATLSACARALRRAGAAQVMGLTLARATPQFPDMTRADDDNPVDGLDRDST